MQPHATTKRCPKCGIEKPREAFAKSRDRHDGLQAYCKECHRPQVNKSSQAYREQPGMKEHYAELHRKRMEDPNDPYRQRRVLHHRAMREDEGVREQDRLQSRENYRKNPERLKAYNRTRFDTLERKARTAVRDAIKAGILPELRYVLCSFPGCTKPARHYHHKSYDEAHWLDVQAVCTKHHGQFHWIDPTVS